MTNKRAKDEKAKRLAEQLRANLQRRKQQARARRDGSEDNRNDGIKAAGPEKKS